MAAPTLDYQALLNGDPAVQLALAHAQTEAQQQRTALTAARRQQLVAYGDVPTSADSSLVGTGLAADINPETRALAQQATSSGLSTLGQLNRAFHQTEAGTDAKLAARGLLHSGLYRQAHLENIHNLQTGEARAQQTALGGLAGAWGDYTAGQAGLANDVNSAASDALSRLSAEIAAGTIAPPATASRTPSADAPSSPLVGGEPKPSAANYTGQTVVAAKPRRTSPYAMKPLY